MDTLTSITTTPDDVQALIKAIELQEEFMLFELLNVADYGT